MGEIKNNPGVKGLVQLATNAVNEIDRLNHELFMSKNNIQHDEYNLKVKKQG